MKLIARKTEGRGRLIAMTAGALVLTPLMNPVAVQAEPTRTWPSASAPSAPTRSAPAPSAPAASRGWDVKPGALPDVRPGNAPQGNWPRPGGGGSGPGGGGPGGGGPGGGGPGGGGPGGGPGHGGGPGGGGPGHGGWPGHGGGPGHGGWPDHNHGGYYPRPGYPYYPGGYGYPYSYNFNYYNYPDAYAYPGYNYPSYSTYGYPVSDRVDLRGTALRVYSQYRLDVQGDDGQIYAVSSGDNFSAKINNGDRVRVAGVLTSASSIRAEKVQLVEDRAYTNGYIGGNYGVGAAVNFAGRIESVQNDRGVLILSVRGDNGQIYSVRYTANSFFRVGDQIRVVGNVDNGVVNASWISR